MGAFYSPGGVGGPAITFMLLKGAGVTASNGLAILIVDKVMTALVAVVSMIIFVSIFNSMNFEINSYFMLSIFASSALGIFLLTYKPLRVKIVEILRDICLFKSHPSVLFFNLLVSVLVFGLCGLQYLLAFGALSITVDNPMLIISSYGVFVAINYLPISVGGIGINELVALALWRNLSLSSESIIAAFIVLRLFALMSALSAAILGAVLK